MDFARLPDNPAARLLPLARRLSRAFDKPTGTVLCEAFGSTDADPVSVLGARTQLMSLLTECRDEIEEIRIDPPPYVRALFIELIRAVGSYDTGTSWRAYRTQWSDANLQTIEFAAYLLGRLRPQPMFTAEELRSFDQRVSRLCEDVRGSRELSLAFKSEISAQLEHVQRSIREYRYAGNKGLKRSVDMLVGVTTVAASIDNANAVKGYWESAIVLAKTVYAMTNSFAPDTPRRDPVAQTLGK
ncbi:MAG: hypothetical protein P4L33_06430 [Capsulimonadaceae bacterium]|nr:hypothetical protein [Capsulimonadaceae bacterium]